MPGWVIAAAIASIAVTAILTFVLWRMNAPQLERQKKGDDGGPIIPVSDGGKHDTDDSGGDGGGDGGGGGK